VSVTEQTKFAYSKFAIAMPSGLCDFAAAMDEKNMTEAMFTITTRAYLGDSITGS
jgi:hypothetical protein